MDWSLAIHRNRTALAAVVAAIAALIGGAGGGGCWRGECDPPRCPSCGPRNPPCAG